MTVSLDGDTSLKDCFLLSWHMALDSRNELDAATFGGGEGRRGGPMGRSTIDWYLNAMATPSPSTITARLATAHRSARSDGELGSPTTTAPLDE